MELVAKKNVVAKITGLADLSQFSRAQLSPSSPTSIPTPPPRWLHHLTTQRTLDVSGVLTQKHSFVICRLWRAAVSCATWQCQQTATTHHTTTRRCVVHSRRRVLELDRYCCCSHSVLHLRT